MQEQDVRRNERCAKAESIQEREAQRSGEQPGMGKYAEMGRRAGTEIVRNRGREGMQEELGHGELQDRQDDGSCS